LLYIFFNIFIGDTLSLITSCLGSCHVTLHASLAVQSSARLLSILTNQTTALGMYLAVIPKDLVDSSLFGQLKYAPWRDSTLDVARC